jgi:hypothetical protein
MPDSTDALPKSRRSALAARVETPEGRDALLRLANQIAQSAVDALPPTLREELKTPAGMEAFQAAWPGIVAEFLMWGVEKSRSENADEARLPMGGSVDGREE